MTTTLKAPGAVAVALTAGLALALLCKLIYDLFNGYAVIPNLLVGLGFFPSAISLEALQFFGLATPAFFVGKALLKSIAGNPGRVASASAIPWVALCIGGVVNGFFGESREALLELSRSSSRLLAAPILMTLAVPFGLWLAYRGERADA